VQGAGAVEEGAGAGGGQRCAPSPKMTCSFLI